MMLLQSTIELKKRKKRASFDLVSRMNAQGEPKVEGDQLNQNKTKPNDIKIRATVRDRR